MTELENPLLENGQIVADGPEVRPKLIQHNPGMPRKIPLATRDSNCW
jgi:hypothetical protein